MKTSEALRRTKAHVRIGTVYRKDKTRYCCWAAAQCGDEVRSIKWMSDYEIQYDGPSVAFRRKFPRVTIEAFRKWAARDVTDELPNGEYAPWPIGD